MDLLAWDLEEAISCCRSLGQEPIVSETRSKKGLVSGEKRVVRCTYDTAGTPVLTWALFQKDTQ